MTAMLEVRDLHVFYGAIHALQGVSFGVNEGEIVTLIGANGAGKSTTLKTISGLLRPRQGSIVFRGTDLTRVSATKIVSLGISQVPEGRKIFAPLTVRDNLEMGAYTREDKAEIEKSLERVFASFPRLKERIHQLGGTLSGGEQQMLAIARALMARPRLILLDEPSEGIMPVLVDEMFALFKRLKSEGTTILLVEQNVERALGISDRAYILDQGRIVHQGVAAALLADQAIQERYCAI